VDVAAQASRRAKPSTHICATTIVVLAALALALPQPAGAAWRRVSVRPSSSQPFFACAPGGRRDECQLIEDPTRGSARRGPVREGAITTGPEQQVSPALQGGGVEGGYSPEDLRAAYGLPSSSAGPVQTMAVVDAFDDPNAESDLSAYRSQYGIAPCNAGSGCFRKVNQTGGSAYPQANARWAFEISLDLDMVSAICPDCHILLVEATENSSNAFAAAENEAVALGATEINNSFGGPALAEPPPLAGAYDHPGIPIVAAGGDSGYGVSSPASNPHVIAVGGTSLQRASGGRGFTEAVWSSGTGGEFSGTGSGCSEETKPEWQSDSGCSYRTTNDVAAVADPNTPVSIYDSFQTSSPWELAGGTSVAAPIVTAAMALADSYTRSFDGAQALYLEAAANGTGALDDVLSGRNGSCGSYLCEAGVGYDGPTGLGSLYGAPTVSPSQVHLPSAQTEPASAVTQSSATLNAIVNPNGGAITRCAFHFGSSEASTPCSNRPGSVSGPIAVSATLTGLLPGTAYRFRIVASNLSGTSSGETLSLTTLGIVQGRPAVPFVLPASSPAPAPPRAVQPGVYATLASASLSAGSSGIVRVKISCPRQTSRCVGVVTLRTARAVVILRHGHRPMRRVLTLATASFKIAGGRVAMVALRLSAAARALLVRAHSLRALAIVDERGRAGAPHASSSTVTIRAVAAGRR
jgi:Subtilase family